MTSPNGVNPRQVETLIDPRQTDDKARRAAAIVADAVIPVVTAFARAYTRGRGFDAETGDVISGPPLRPLGRIDVETRDDGMIWALGRSQAT